MLGSEVLEVAIGLIFVYLIASLLASTIRELIESLLKSRASQLIRGMKELLDDESGKAILPRLFDHPLLYSLFRGAYNAGKSSNLPSYVPSRNFALAVLDLVGGDGKPGSNGALDLGIVHANAMALKDGKLRQAVLVAVGEAENDLDRARTSLEAWFDGSMDRVSGWYKRRTQAWLLAIGLVLAAGLNIDSLAVVRTLATDNAVRRSTIQRIDQAYPVLADKLVNAAPATPPGEKPKPVDPAAGTAGAILTDDQKKALDASVHSQVEGLSGLIGWEKAPKADGWGWFPRVLGWMITALAVSLGAPFWFDLLNKFMVVRATVKPYEKSPAEGSEDRRGSRASADKLAPDPNRAAVRDAVDSSGAAAFAPESALVRLRLGLSAAAELAPGSLVLTLNDKAVPVDDAGCAEPLLTVASVNTLSATAKTLNDGKTVNWSTTLTPCVEEDGSPMEGVLV